METDYLFTNYRNNKKNYHLSLSHFLSSHFLYLLPIPQLFCPVTDHNSELNYIFLLFDVFIVEQMS